jgi:hypothetical protein
MNHEKIYYQIIENRKRFPLTGVYTESHHIIPKSLGGSDDKLNLVKLTSREHYICHALLAEMYEYKSIEWYKMNHAFLMMKCNTGKQNRYFNSKLYELKRNDFSKTMSYNQTAEKNSQFNSIWIHNDNVEKKIQNKDIIPNGWQRGRIKKKKIKQDSNVYVDGLIIKKYQQNKIIEIFKIIPTINGIRTLKSKLETLYNTNLLSTNDISKMFNTSNETIRNYLKLFNITRRTLSESNKIKHTP